MLAIQSPLHHLADLYLYSAHMTQHLLLSLIIPPLLLLGIPGWLVRPVLDHGWVRRFGRTAGYPVLAYVAFNLVFAYIHLPAIYDWAFSNELAHFLIHAALLTTGLFTWMPLLSPVPDILPRLSLPSQMFYCFAQTIPGSLVGSLIALADHLLYQHYGVAPLALGIDPLADQSMGGLLMWVVGGTFFLVLLTVLFFKWAAQEEKKEVSGPG